MPDSRAAMTAPPPDWTGAACLGVRGFHDTAPDSIERALALCNGTDTTPVCPRKAACARWAAGQTDSYSKGYDGIAGGRFLVNGRDRTPAPVLPCSVSTEVLKAGHSRYRAGDRSPWNVECYREWERVRKSRERRVAA